MLSRKNVQITDEIQLRLKNVSGGGAFIPYPKWAIAIFHSNDFDGKHLAEQFFEIVVRVHPTQSPLSPSPFPSLNRLRSMGPMQMNCLLMISSSFLLVVLNHVYCLLLAAWHMKTTINFLLFPGITIYAFHSDIIYIIKLFNQ